MVFKFHVSNRLVSRNEKESLKLLFQSILGAGLTQLAISRRLYRLQYFQSIMSAPHFDFCDIIYVTSKSANVSNFIFSNFTLWVALNLVSGHSSHKSWNIG